MAFLSGWSKPCAGSRPARNEIGRQGQGTCRLRETGGGSFVVRPWAMLVEEIPMSLPGARGPRREADTSPDKYSATSQKGLEGNCLPTRNRWRHKRTVLQPVGYGDNEPQDGQDVKRVNCASMVNKRQGTRLGDIRVTLARRRMAQCSLTLTTRNSGKKVADQPHVVNPPVTLFGMPSATLTLGNHERLTMANQESKPPHCPRWTT